MTPRLPFLVLLALAVGGVAQTTAADLRRSERAEAGTVLDPRGGTHPAAATLAQPETADGSTWYCAGSDVVVVANPTEHAVKGVLTVYGGATTRQPDAAAPEAGGPATEKGGATEEAFAVPARDQRRFRLADLRPDDPVAGVVVELDAGGVVVEQEIDRSGGSDAAPCTTASAPQWHLAWGDTSRAARQLLVLFNPFPRDVTVDARFSVDGGVREPVPWQGLVVPARRVVAVDLGADVRRQDQVAATVLSRGGHLIVSRVQSYDGTGGPGGVSLAAGEPAGAERWVFAHGRVDGRTDERIVLYNPGRWTAEVDVTLDGLGPDVDRPQPFAVVVRPGGFEVVDYTVEARVESGVAHATVVQSRNGVPVVAERVLTFEAGRRRRTGGEVSAGPGAPVEAQRWAFPALLPGDQDDGGDDDDGDGDDGDGGDGDDDDGDEGDQTGEGDRDQGRRRGDRDRRDGTGVTARVAVMNTDPEHAARVSIAVDDTGDRTRPADLQHVKVPPRGRVTLDLPALSATASVVVESDRAVVADRILVRDGQVVALGPGVPIPAR